MKLRHIYIFFLLLALGCSDSKVEKIKPTTEAISESVYASGIIKSKDQYLAFATVSGVIDTIFVSEGDTVKVGTPILSIANEAQRLNKENAQIAAQYFDFNANSNKLQESKLQIEQAKSKYLNDSILYFRQLSLFENKASTKVDLERKELTFTDSRANYEAAKLRYNELKRQIDFSSNQARKNLSISNKLQSDFILRSEINGIVYNITKSKGDIVNPQIGLAVLGKADKFILEMQVDEYDILKIRLGQAVIVALDSYKGKVFEAKVSKIYPYMNERSKSFLVEAEFIESPAVLYPNISFEASIIISKKERALLIPRTYLLNDSTVVNANKEQIKVKTGLKDYKKVEILSGINSSTELIKPTQ